MRRAPVLAVFGLPVLLTVVLSAQSHDVWQSLVDAERAFAGDSVRTTMREAFLAHLHPQSVMFNPGPVNGIELYTARPSRPVQLAWAPEVVDVAASGDFGYSTGPHQLRRAPEGEILRRGYFCSVWVRSAGAPWKVLIDLGTSQPTPVSLDVTPRDPTPTAGTSAGAGAAKTLAEAERQFATAAAGDQVATYRALLARHARVYRDGGAPVEGVLPALDVIARRGKLVRVTPEKTDVATSGDLGYAYGRLELADAAPGAPPVYYVRVWRHDTQGWRVVLDVDTWVAAR
jgi:ketosteroid isomerase-like protein